MFVIYLLSLFYTNFLQKKRQVFFFKFELYKNRIASIINLDNKTRGVIIYEEHQTFSVSCNSSRKRNSSYEPNCQQNWHV